MSRPKPLPQNRGVQLNANLAKCAKDALVKAAKLEKMSVSAYLTKLLRKEFEMTV